MFRFYICKINDDERVIFEHKCQFKCKLEEIAHLMAMKHGKCIWATHPQTAVDVFEMLESESE
jgi:hypothetical protein